MSYRTFKLVLPFGGIILPNCVQEAVNAVENRDALGFNHATWWPQLVSFVVNLLHLIYGPRIVNVLFVATATTALTYRPPDVSFSFCFCLLHIQMLLFEGKN